MSLKEATKSAFMSRDYCTPGYGVRDDPWEMEAAQWAFICHATDADPWDQLQPLKVGGADWESGRWLIFKDDSVYFANGGRHEVWRDSKDFLFEYDLDADHDLEECGESGPR